jgi:hypothetical protein
MLMARALFVLSMLLVAGRAAAEADPRPTQLAVDFERPTSGPTWFVSALEETVGRELLRFNELRVAEKLDRRLCPDREPRCLVDQYRAAGVQVIILGKLRGRALAFEVYDTWTGTRAFDGSLKVADVTTSTLRRHVGDIVRPIVQRGGLLDQRPALVESAAPATPAASAKPTPERKASPAKSSAAPTAKVAAAPPAKVVAAAPPAKAAEAALPAARRDLTRILLGLMALVALPVLLARLLVGGRELRKRERPASWKWSALVEAALALLLLASVLIDVREALTQLATSKAAALLLPISAGMLWGAVGLLNAGWVFAPIHGLGQIRHEGLWPLLRAWIALALLRAILLLFYVPVVVLTVRGAATLGFPPSVTLGLVLPITGLLAYFWLLSLVDNLALFLDAQLVIGPASARNPWHTTIKRYFRGYVRRNAIDLDVALLERTLFLPSLLPNVISYGGGFARPRILVGEQAREVALGGLPEEADFPDRTVNPEEMPCGFLVPSSAAEQDGQRLARAEMRRRELTLAPLKPRGAAPRLMGENATLLGWVLPQPVDGGIPLISNTSEDYDVVKRLLTEHYAAFERGLDEDEVDDTDPTQKDFLFGALIREFGVLTRRDSFLSTIRYSLVLGSQRLAWLYRFVVRPPIKFYERFLAGPGAKVADAYAALNHGLHHLIQYLFFLRVGEEAPLTARANVPRLMQTSREMVERISRDRLSAEERHLLRATPRERALWLSQSFFAPVTARRSQSLRVLAGIALAVTVGILIVTAVVDAVDYHPTYVERMQQERANSKPGDGPDDRPAAR